MGADRLNLTGFEEAKKQRLHPQAHLSDFVHEDRAAVGLFEQAAFVAVRVGEAAADMAEELGLEQRLRDARAVQGDQPPVRSPAALVNKLGDNLFAHSAFAGNQDFGVGRTGEPDFLVNQKPFLADTDHIAGLDHDCSYMTVTNLKTLCRTTQYRITKASDKEKSQHMVISAS